MRARRRRAGTSRPRRRTRPAARAAPVRRAAPRAAARREERRGRRGPHAASPVEQRPERLREVCSGQVRCGEGCARPSLRVPRLEAQQKSDIQGLRTYGVESGRDQCLGALRRRLPWNRRLTRVSGHRARSLRPRGAHGVRPQGRAEQRKWLCTHFGQVSGMVNPARTGEGDRVNGGAARVRAGGGRRRRPRPGRGGAGAGERLCTPVGAIFSRWQSPRLSSLHHLQTQIPSTGDAVGFPTRGSTGKL